MTEEGRGLRRIIFRRGGKFTDCLIKEVWMLDLPYCPWLVTVYYFSGSY